MVPSYEVRLRAKRISAAASESADDARPFYAQLQLRDRQPPRDRVAVGEIRLLHVTE